MQGTRDALVWLYGDRTAADVERLLDSAVAACSGRLPPPATRRTALPLDQSDALLITYGDQVREADQPPLRTLADFAELHLQGVVSGLHVLPFYPSSSDDGFSVMDYHAVDPALGSWEDITRLAGRFDLMFDAVFNHMSAQGIWFRRDLQGTLEDGEFFVWVDGDPDLSRVVRPRVSPVLTGFETSRGPRRAWTTFSADQVDLNLRNPKVLLALVEVLLFYVSRGARFIRLDAIAYLWKEPGTSCIHLPQTHRFIQLLRTILDQVAPQVLLITETNVPHADNISYFGDGANEAQLVYNFALPPLVLHAFATGRADALARWARTLRLPSAQTGFFNFLASHDGIGLNPVRGILGEADIGGLVERAQAHGGRVSWKQNPDGSRSPYELNISYFDALSDPAAEEPLDLQIRRFLGAHSILASLAGLPGIYFHSLFGSRNDLEGVRVSGIARRINRRKLLRADLEHELSGHGLRRRVFDGLSGILKARRARAAFHPLGPQWILETDPRVLAILRVDPSGETGVLCLHNVSSDSVKVIASLPVEAESLRVFQRPGGRNPVERELAPCQFEWIDL